MSSLTKIYDALEQATNNKTLYEPVTQYVVQAEQSLKHTLRPYQQHALQRFFHYETQYQSKKQNNYLLFEMATGTGKTLIMAALLPYFYARGYRTILFFVNSTAIIEKTRQNFIDTHSSKYVFAAPLVIDGQRIEVQAVSSIAETNPACINILFTTIQGLHSTMQNPKENSVTLEDFAEHKIILLADEAHHINTQTKSELKLEHSWESTIAGIYAQNPDNYLLEFTATAALENKAIKEKYNNKVLVRYGLREFRKDGYSKHPKVAQAKTESIEDRFLLSIMLSQYRQEIAAKHNLDIKPVLLYKSKTIKASKAAKAQFHTVIESLEEHSVDELLVLVKKHEDIPLYRKVYEFFTSGSFSHTYFAERLRLHFAANKTIDVNNDGELAAMQVALNTLEDATNKYRVIFAVDKLNEGWDVLNLYDIVKLYKTPTTQGKPPTTQEIQLIGRGARLFPFVVEAEQERYRRKYDDTAHELSVLEQLHFHTADGSKFIEQLNQDLQTAGLTEPDTEEQEICVKESFQKSSIYKDGYLYTNQRIKRERKNIFQTDLFGGIFSNESDKMDQRFADLSGVYTADVDLDVFDLYAKKQAATLEYTKMAHLQLGRDIPNAVFLKAASKVVGLYFANVAKKLELKSILDMKERFAKNRLTIYYPKGRNKTEVLTPRTMLEVTRNFLENLNRLINEVWTEYIGTETLERKHIKEVFVNKKIRAKTDDMLSCKEIPHFAQDQIKATSYEQELIQELCARLEDSRIPVKWLLRNERHFALYNIADGKGFEPDFLLILEDDSIYQIFVEPKGEHLQGSDAWKQQLMQHIATLQTHDPKHKIAALPFYNQETKGQFFEKLEPYLGERTTQSTTSRN